MLAKIEKYKKYFVFTGKANRSEYWGVYLVGVLLIMLVGLLATMIALISAPFTLVLIGFIGWISALAIVCVGSVLEFWMWIATAIRRCNDADINPWFAITLLLPAPLNLIPFIVFGCLPSEENV
jgi:uncharacterized membrane protein YhaH (DUF805 family)